MELLDTLAREFFNHLSEKEKRLFAALEATRLGRHGVQRASEFYQIHPNTIRRGKRELATGTGKTSTRVREPGGGRKKSEETYPTLDAIFLAILRGHTAGDPMNEDVHWTYLNDTEIRERLEAHGCPVSRSVVKRLLKKHQYGQRVMNKRKTFKQNPDRNAQFEQIQAVTATEAEGPNPILSMDTKKKNTLDSCIGEEPCMSRPE
jgi:hypothetical protein